MVEGLVVGKPHYRPLPNNQPCQKKRRLVYLEVDVFPIGSRVRAVPGSPFRGRKGTVLAINMIATPGEPILCFYLVALDRTYLWKLLWFEHQEIELLAPACDQVSECKIS